jgi:benzylsuccinate CoA-transferase BbsE subunit
MTGGNTALAGLRVLDLANEYGVYCGKLLAGMGAEVIKVERPGGDPTRNIGLFQGDAPHPEKSLFFAYHNTGKKSVTLDLESQEGAAIFKKLAGTADVVLETSPAGYLPGLGLGYTSLREVNPWLVMTSITPFGQSGPHSNYLAPSEIVPLAMGGLMYMTGEPSTPPVQVGHYLVGHAVGIYAAVGTLAAVHGSRFTGAGEHVDISMQECIASWLEASHILYQYSNHRITGRTGNEHPYITPGRLFPCKDGYCNIGAPGRWNEIVVWLIEKDIDVGDLADPKYVGPGGDDLLFANRPRINQIMSDLTRKYTKKEIMLEGQQRGIPVTAMEDAESVYDEDQHLEARGYFVEVEHPVLGKLKYPGAPFLMTASPWQIGGPAPLVGQNNQEIYSALGMDEQELAVLKAAGVI